MRTSGTADAERLVVDLQIACDEPGVPEIADVRRYLDLALAGAGVEGEAEIGVRVVGRDEMQTLNRDYRNQDKPTNVLSFPAGPIEGLPESETTALGDIVVCAPVVREEAARQDKPQGDHWAHMLVHGTLHLLGHDHVQDDEAREMERLEVQILASAGLSDPYREQ